MSETIPLMFDGVQWSETGATPNPDSDLPYATHAGVWRFQGIEMRVYRLSNGQAVIHADDMYKFFDWLCSIETLEPKAAPESLAGFLE